MSEMNEKIVSEFLELMKRVNAIEVNQQVIANKQDDILNRAARVQQDTHDYFEKNTRKYDSSLSNLIMEITKEHEAMKSEIIGFNKKLIAIEEHVKTWAMFNGDNYKEMINTARKEIEVLDNKFEGFKKLFKSLYRTLGKTL